MPPKTTYFLLNEQGEHLFDLHQCQGEGNCRHPMAWPLFPCVGGNSCSHLAVTGVHPLVRQPPGAIRAVFPRGPSAIGAITPFSYCQFDECKVVTCCDVSVPLLMTSELGTFSCLLAVHMRSCDPPAYPHLVFMDALLGCLVFMSFTCAL